MHAIFLVAIVASHVAVLGLNVAMWMQLKRFLRRYPRINNESDLTSYKALVRVQMISTLVGFALLATPWVLWLVGHFGFGALWWLDLLLYVALPCVLNAGLIALMAGPAEDAKRLEAANEQLQAEVARVVDTWIKKLLPDWH